MLKLVLVRRCLQDIPQTSIAAQNDHFADIFVRENSVLNLICAWLGYFYDFQFLRRCHFVLRNIVLENL